MRSDQPVEEDVWRESCHNQKICEAGEDCKILLRWWVPSSLGKQFVTQKD